MRKTILLVVLFLFALSVPVVSTVYGKNELQLPVQANDQAVVSLGQAFDRESGQLVEGFAIIHRRDQAAKPNNSGSKGGTKCYTYLASGAKWKSVENWVVNSQNSRGLAESVIFSNLDFGINKWEDAADGVVGNSSAVNILGAGSLTSNSLVADLDSPDGVNEVYFGAINESNAIAITIVWGIFSGPPSGRVLVEWDQIYDDVDYDWSANGEVGKMDFESLATHELGHSVGMGDLYTSSCVQETMYGYADFGEINKRDLNSGDIKGISTLY